MPPSLPTGTVTFLFTDIEGSTQLWEQHSEVMKTALAWHDAILREAIAAQHGFFIKITGDGVHAVFTTVVEALAAALAAQRQLQAQDRQSNPRVSLKVRMGIHTGEAELRDGDYFGPALNRAARIMSAGHGGQILLSEVAAQLAQEHLPGGTQLLDMGIHHLKGLSRPEHIFQLSAADLPQEFPLLNSLETTANNLPTQLTSFIGREKEISEVRKMIAATRILTFIGPGGTGKTRLTLQLGRDQLAEFKDGAWFVELAPLSDAAYIVSTIASVFNLREVQGVPPITILVDYLRGKQLLLILDNCEHLVEACARLADQLLRECPQLKILVSSREALGISGETVYRVPSLKDEEAVSLFSERAVKADSRFRMTEENRPFIAQICARLDGIPLALELAAARVKLFTPRQIAERLDDRFKLLTGGSRTALPRQQTLRALIDWSYQTLNETEQRALRRLAVFSGGWTFEAAEAVIGESEAFDGLAGLVNKSMVNVEERERASRYFFLETIRQFAMEKLVETGEAVEMRNRQLDFMLNYVDIPGTDPLALPLNWLDKLDNDHDNLRTALEWGVANDIDKAIQLALKVSFYWSTRDYISEALFWFTTILQKSEGLAGHDSERASLYAQMGWMSILIGHHRDGRAAAEKAISLGTKLNQDKTRIFACCTLALASVFLGDHPAAEKSIMEAEVLAREKGLMEELALVTSSHAQIIYLTTRDIDRAKEYLDEAISLSAVLGYSWETAFLIFVQARLAASLGDIETARVKFIEGADIARRAGNKRMVYSNRSELAHALRGTGQFDEALEIYKELIPCWNDLGHRAALAREMECIAYILIRRKEPDRATRLLSAAQAIRKVIDIPRSQLEDLEDQKELASLNQILGEGEFKKLWLQGENLSMDQAIELALGTA